MRAGRESGTNQSKAGLLRGGMGVVKGEMVLISCITIHTGELWTWE